MAVLKNNSHSIGNIILKIGKEEHIRKLHEFGEIYFSPISHFKKVEKTSFRGDPNEGLAELSQAPNVRISVKVDGEDEVSWLDSDSGLTGQVKLGFHDAETVGIFSASIATLKGDQVIFNDEMAKFGSHGLAIYRSRIFLDRLFSHVKENNISFESRLVDYVDSHSYTGKMGIFRKFEEYGYQNEIRFAVFNRPTPHKIILGSLSDVADVFEIKMARVIEEIN